MSTVVNARIAADAKRLAEKRSRNDPRVAVFLARLAKEPIRVQPLGRGR